MRFSLKVLASALLLTLLSCGHGKMGPRSPGDLRAMHLQAGADALNLGDPDKAIRAFEKARPDCAVAVESQ